MVSEISQFDGVLERTDQLRVKTVHPRELIDVLIKGLSDFKAMPTHIIFLCLIYPVVIAIFARVYAGYEVLPLIFPLLAGYTLIGPLVATGMYELSRRREKGIDTSRKKAFHVLQRHATRSIGLLGILLTAIYLIWLYVALFIWDANFNNVSPSTIAEFASLVIFTAAGHNLILIGSSTGFAFAIVVLSLSVISFPMLMDRDVSISLAIKTSIIAVLKNPITMGIWGVIVVATLFLGALPLFVGLSVALPVLGHSTWQLYRKIVEYN